MHGPQGHNVTQLSRGLRVTQKMDTHRFGALQERQTRERPYAFLVGRASLAQGCRKASDKHPVEPRVILQLTWRFWCVVHLAASSVPSLLHTPSLSSGFGQLLELQMRRHLRKGVLRGYTGDIIAEKYVAKWVSSLALAGGRSALGTRCSFSCTCAHVVPEVRRPSWVACRGRWQCSVPPRGGWCLQWSLAQQCFLFDVFCGIQKNREHHSAQMGLCVDLTKGPSAGQQVGRQRSKSA